MSSDSTGDDGRDAQARIAELVAARTEPPTRASRAIGDLDDEQMLVMGIIISELIKWRRPVQVGAIGEIAWAGGRGLDYGSTNRILAGLERRGLISSPSRGAYLLADAVLPDT